MVDVYLVVQLTTTCDEHGVYVTKDSSEIIEISWIMIHSSTLQEIGRNSVLIRPASTPITPLCTSLTTLTWEHVQQAGTFRDGIAAFDKQVQELALNQGNEVSFVTLNSWDLRVQLQREARDKGVVLPPYMQHPRIYDLRTEYGRWQVHHPEMAHCSASSISAVCTALEVQKSPVGNLYQPPSMRPRRALEDAELTADILRALIVKSQPLEQHPDVMTRPLDSKADVRQFLQEKSKVLHLSNLPHDITQSELESWFTQYGGRPVAFWTLRTPDNSNSETGFAVFSTHEEAAESLSMNGRALNERAIEVSPSGNAVIERARSILMPFPSSKNRPRPGDWTCPACGFSNFQRRTACFRCSFPSNSNPGVPNPQDYSFHSNGNHNNHHLNGHNQQHHHHNHSHNDHGMKANKNNGGNVPFRAGDWKCANEGCNYHNFAKNLYCLRCGAARAVQVIGDPHTSAAGPSSSAMQHTSMNRYPNAQLIYGQNQGSKQHPQQLLGQHNPQFSQLYQRDSTSHSMD